MVLIKWSKTMQRYNHIKLISLPRLFKSPIFPVCAIANALALTPKSSNLPLFQAKSESDWVQLIDTKVRRHFNLVLSRLNLSGAGYTFHIFRRSGATFALITMSICKIFKNMAPEHWTVWRYRTDRSDADDQVAQMFTAKFSASTILLLGFGWFTSSLYIVKLPCHQILYITSVNLMLAQGHISVCTLISSSNSAGFHLLLI